MLGLRRRFAIVPICAVAVMTLGAQEERLPSARLVAAPRLAVLGAVDSNVPMAWDLVDGSWRLFAFPSWGGIPARLSGAAVDQLEQAGPLAITNHPGHGVWFESVIADEAGAWYSYYHHEMPAYECGRLDRSIPRIGSARSTDRGSTWEDLGIILEAPPGSTACGSPNRYVIGGVGDPGAVLARDGTDLFIYYSQYSRVPAEQGVMAARLAWADREAPAGKITIWNNGAWLPPRLVRPANEEQPAAWEFPSGTPLVRVTEPWHDNDEAVDAFWGPSIHWNAYLDRFVMLLTRAKNEAFNNAGIYISYGGDPADPRGWSRPQKVLNGGAWYPQVAGLEVTIGSDKQAGQRARFLMTGRSDHFIEFTR